MRFWLRYIVLGLLAALAAIANGADVLPEYPQHSLVRIKLAPDETVAVLSQDFLPIDLVTLPGELAVFTGPPGRYAVIVSGGQGITGVVVTRIVGQVPPGPNPPGPTPPGPTPPNPDVPNKYGVGLAAYTAAVAVGKPAEAVTMADIYNSAAARMAGLGTGDLVADVTAVNNWIRQQRQERLPSPAWQLWADQMQIALRKSWVSGNNTKEAYGATLLEVSSALRLIR